jgi:hypothetical protein
MGEGWLRLHRKARHSAVFTDPGLWHLWSYLLMEANWTEKRLPDGRILQPGQLARACRRIAGDLGISKSEAGRKLAKLESQGRIKCGTQGGTQARVITICNWETYQGLEEAGRDANGDADGTQAGRKRDARRDIKKNKRREEGKKGRNTRNVIPPEIEWLRAYCLERKNGIDAQDFYDTYARQGWRLSNGQKMTDWQAAIRTWEKRRKDDGQQRKLFPSQHHDPQRPCEPL